MILSVAFAFAGALAPLFALSFSFSFSLSLASEAVRIFRLFVVVAAVAAAVRWLVDKAGDIDGEASAI